MASFSAAYSLNGYSAFSFQEIAVSAQYEQQVDYKDWNGRLATRILLQSIIL